MFQCDRCGLCCRKVFKSKLYQDLDRGDGICKYFVEDKKICSIYIDRPDKCNVDKMYEIAFQKIISKEEYYRQNYYACNLMKREDKKMSTIKDALIKKFEEIFEFELEEETYAPRLKNARSIICQGKYSKDDIIYIWDNSISMEGKAGLVLTVDSVCVKDGTNFTAKL